MSQPQLGGAATQRRGDGERERETRERVYMFFTGGYIYRSSLPFLSPSLPSLESLPSLSDLPFYPFSNVSSLPSLPTSLLFLAHLSPSFLPSSLGPFRLPPFWPSLSLPSLLLPFPTITVTTITIIAEREGGFCYTSCYDLCERRQGLVNTFPSRSR